MDLSILPAGTNYSQKSVYSLQDYCTRDGSLKAEKRKAEMSSLHWLGSGDLYPV
jgi:hypothetical protein